MSWNDDPSFKDRILDWLCGRTPFKDLVFTTMLIAGSGTGLYFDHMSNMVLCDPSLSANIAFTKSVFIFWFLVIPFYIIGSIGSTYCLWNLVTGDGKY